MLRVRAGLLPILLFVAASSPGIPAQEPDPTLPDPATLAPAEIQRLFNAMVAMQAQDALRLSEQQYVQFLVRLKTLQATRSRLLQERNKLFAELTRLTNPKLNPSATDAELKERVAAWHELESRAVAEMRKAYNGVDEVLTPHQQAHFRVFEEQIERRKLDLLVKARARTLLKPSLP